MQAAAHGTHRGLSISSFLFLCVRKCVCFYFVHFCTHQLSRVQSVREKPISPSAASAASVCRHKHGSKGIRVRGKPENDGIERSGKIGIFLFSMLLLWVSGSG